MNTSQVLQRYGWVKGEFGSKACGFCVVGAYAHAHDISRHTALDELNSLLTAYLKEKP